MSELLKREEEEPSVVEKRRAQIRKVWDLLHLYINNTHKLAEVLCFSLCLGLLYGRISTAEAAVLYTRARCCTSYFPLDPLSTEFTHSQLGSAFRTSVRQGLRVQDSAFDCQSMTDTPHIQYGTAVCTVGH